MNPSVLFSGLRFVDKKRCRPLGNIKGRDLDVKSPAEEPVPSVHVGAVSHESVEARGLSKKKNKMRGLSNNVETATDVGPVDPISILGVTHLAPEPLHREENSEDIPTAKEKISASRQEEEVRVLRKRYGLHVAGQKIPSPLADFNQLESIRHTKLLLKRVSDAGYAEPTPIQRQAIPVLLSRRECLSCAPTGSGKTLAFMLPIVMTLKASRSEGIRAVILCPIRELAAQIARECRTLIPGKKPRIRVLTISLFKTADFSTLLCDILITTPLRLEHLLKAKKIDLSRVEYLVMDESDKLFEMGFVEQIDSVVAACSNPKVVRALFSATLPDTVEELARTIMLDPIRIVVGEKNTATSTVDQKLLYVGSEEGKLLALRQIFRKSLRPPVLLFVDSKERAKELHRELAFEDIKVDIIHADRSQEQRNAAVEKFREAKTWVLVATDVMARGMDFKGVNFVINYDFPQSIATYIHRIGRSGRAGRSGEAVTFYTEKDVPYLRSIAHVIRGAGCEVPDWMLALPKVKPQKWKRTA